jgi:hypothetical protein
LLVAFDAVAIVPPVPEIMLQLPVPALAVFAASVVDKVLHGRFWSAPAFAVVGTAGMLITTSSDDEQEPAVIVQRNVYD